MSVNNFFKLIYKFMLFFTLSYLITYPFIGILWQNVFRCIYILLAIVLLLGYIRFYKSNFSDNIAFLLIILISVCCILITQMQFSGENIYHVFSFYTFILFIISHNFIKVDKKLLKFIYFFSVITTIVLIIYSQTSYAYWDGNRFVDRLTLGLYNANFTGIILLFLYCLIMITMKYLKYSCFSLLLEGFLLYLIFLTGSRTSFFAAIFIPIVTIIMGKRKIYNFIILCFCSIPFIFVKFYLDLYNHLDTFSFFGRDLFSGRQNTFVEYLNNIQTPTHFLIGNIGENLLGNAHNAPLAIFASIGLLGLIVYYFMVIKKLIVLNKSSDNTISKISIFVILACFIHSTGEAACFLGVFPISVFVYTFFVLAGTKDEDIK